MKVDIHHRPLRTPAKHCDPEFPRAIFGREIRHSAWEKTNREKEKIAASPAFWKIPQFASNPAPKNPPQKRGPLLESQSNGRPPQSEAPKAEDCWPSPKSPKAPKAPRPTRRDQKPVSAIPSPRQTKQTQTLARQFELDTIPANRRQSNAEPPLPEKHDCETDPAGRRPDHNPPARLAQKKIRKTTKRQRQTQAAPNDATKRRRKSSNQKNSQTLKFQASDATARKTTDNANLMKAAEENSNKKDSAEFFRSQSSRRRLS